MVRLARFARELFRKNLRGGSAEPPPALRVLTRALVGVRAERALVGGGTFGPPLRSQLLLGLGRPNF